MRPVLLVFLLLAASCDSGPQQPQSVRKQMVFFASDRGGRGNMNIWRMTPEGEDLQQITFYPEGDYWPSDLSPDGKRLLFYRFDASTLASAIYLLDLGAQPPDLDDELIPGFSQGGSFFPDGKRFAYDRFIWTTNTTGHQAVFIYDLRDNSTTLISPLGEAARWPAVSPDGNWICFGGSRDPLNTHQLFMMRADGTGKRDLTPPELGLFAWHCSFSPDGGKILFQMNSRGHVFDLHWIDPQGGDLHRITGEETPGPAGSYDFPRSDPSGQRIYFRVGTGERPTSESEIMAIDLEGGQVKRLTNDRFRDDKPVVGVVEMLE